MRSRSVFFAAVVVTGIAMCCLSCGKESRDREVSDEAGTGTYSAADTVYWNLLTTYLQEHFDDFHDVTMRYHHQDHTINGLVEIKMNWENQVLKSAEVVTNETGSDDLPEALIEKMKGWNIEGLDGPAEITLPVRVKLVGLDDPEFPNTAILTGEVTDQDGNPIPDALIMIKPQVAGMVYRARTNREGIFVRTLIPPATWDLECSHSGYETVTKEGVSLAAGDHHRECETPGCGIFRVGPVHSVH